MSPFNQIPMDAIILYRKSLEMSGRGNYESALTYLSNAVMIAPQFATAICEMGHCYEKLGRFPEAVSKFDKVIRMHPTHIEAGPGKDPERQVMFFLNEKWSVLLKAEKKNISSSVFLQ